LFLFSKRTPPAKKPIMSRVGDVVITRRLSLAEYQYTQPCFINVVVGDVVWPGEIPPGWELEWVDDDE
jgi:hypothetical protein